MLNNETTEKKKNYHKKKETHNSYQTSVRDTEVYAGTFLEELPGREKT